MKPTAARAAEDAADQTSVRSEAKGRDLALEQKLDGTCGPGDECTFIVTLTNNGPDRFSGALNILRTANYRLAKHQASEGVTCKRKLSVVACRTPRLDLEAGQSFRFESKVTVAREATGQIRNCTMLLFQGRELKDPYEDLLVVVQLGLKARGLYEDGEVDGKTGPKVRAAIRAFRETHDLPEGSIDRDFLDALFEPNQLMSGDTDPSNNQACDVTKTSDADVAAASRQPVARPAVRRSPPPRRTSPNDFSSKGNGVLTTNPKQLGLD